MITGTQIHEAARILQRLRRCDKKVPCAFCRWQWDDNTNHRETGCLFIAEQMLTAAETVLNETNDEPDPDTIEADQGQFGVGA